MIEIRYILCPIDFSDVSRRALDHAVAVARWYDSTITLLHVRAVPPAAAYAPEIGVFPPPVLTPEKRRAMMTSMQRFAETETGTSTPIDFQVAEGGAAEEILAAAAATPTDLIVMGTHGRTGFERFALGSVTEKVLRKAYCPVLSVPPHARDVVPAPPVLFKGILCAVDFSACSMRALNYAMSLAQAADARLTIVHVIELPPSVSPADETTVGGPRSVDEYAAIAAAERGARLADAIPDSVRAYCTVDTVLATGKPYREILRVAAEQSSDLIVVGIHGRTAADMLFFGSTAQHLVRQAPCPVLTLRTEGSAVVSKPVMN